MNNERPTEKILLAHGSGGKLTHNLIEKYFAPGLLKKRTVLDDSAVLSLTIPEPLSTAPEPTSDPRLLTLNRSGSGLTANCRIAFTTDSYVVDPIFFPGGNIGDLAVNGTVNDLSMVGAKPLYVSVGFIIEEGLLLADLERIIRAMREAADRAGIEIVAGDTKVVNRGKADKVFINTSGIGIIPEGIHISSNAVSPGDKIILSGSIGDHGIAVLSEREGFKFSASIESDTSPLNRLVEDMIDATKEIHAMRDPTRGGLATILKEFAVTSDVGIIIEESMIPVKDGVKGVCELLGLDPIYVACEGRLVACVAAHIADMLTERMRSNPYGKDAVVIGEVVKEPKGVVLMKTVSGGKRIVDMPVGEQLPRIC